MRAGGEQFIYLLDSRQPAAVVLNRAWTPQPAPSRFVGKVVNRRPPRQTRCRSIARARAWLNYDDGKLYKIPTTRRPASTSGYQTGVVPTAKMGFCSDSPRRQVESLYLASFGTRIAALEAQPARPDARLSSTKIGNFASSPTSPEMTGTGAAELYRTFRQADATHRIIRVNKPPHRPI